jgi:hypothetical protein
VRCSGNTCTTHGRHALENRLRCVRTVRKECEIPPDLRCRGRSAQPCRCRWCGVTGDPHGLRLWAAGRPTTSGGRVRPVDADEDRALALHDDARWRRLVTDPVDAKPWSPCPPGSTGSPGG